MFRLVKSEGVLFQEFRKQCKDDKSRKTILLMPKMKRDAAKKDQI